jgi:hypothetical protein
MRKAGASESEIQQAREQFENASEQLLKEEVGGGGSDKENEEGTLNRGANASTLSSQPSVRGQGHQQSDASMLVHVPEGYESFLLENVHQTADEDERTDFAQGSDRPEELIAYEGVNLIANMSWSFSFQQREEMTDAYYAKLAEQQELERIRKKKEIPNIVKTLDRLKGDADLLTKNLEMLSLTLASESCHKMDGPIDSTSHVLMSNIPRLLMQFRSIFIEFKEASLPISASVSLMKCCTYMKIICKNAGEAHLNSFKKHFAKAGIFTFVAEMFEDFKDRSRLLSLKILSFLTFIINDIQDLYFEFLSGVRLDPFLEYATSSDENRADSEILRAHCQFVNSVCYCLFEHKPTEETEQVVIADLQRISSIVYRGIHHLISGGVNAMYAADHERLVTLYSDVALRVIHLSIQKFALVIRGGETGMLSNIFEGLFVILADSIVSRLSLEFVEQLKDSINYEIQLIQQLEIKRDLGLVFDMAEVQSKLTRLLEEYAANLKQGAQASDEYQKDLTPYFSNTRSIFQFFTNEACLDSFAENNYQVIQRVLQSPDVSNAHDFVIFLHLAVKADLANESEVEGEDAFARQKRIKQSRYGKLTNINRFSMSHIEWLDDAMPNMAGL